MLCLYGKRVTYVIFLPSRDNGIGPHNKSKAKQAKTGIENEQGEQVSRWGVDLVLSWRSEKLFQDEIGGIRGMRNVWLGHRECAWYLRGHSKRNRNGGVSLGCPMPISHSQSLLYTVFEYT